MKSLSNNYYFTLNEYKKKKNDHFSDNLFLHYFF